MDISEEALSVGVLHRGSACLLGSGYQGNCFAFQHLTFLEFLAAYRLVSLVSRAPDAERLAVLSEHFDKVRVLRSRRTFWKFVASLFSPELRSMYMSALLDEIEGRNAAGEYRRIH